MSRSLMSRAAALLAVAAAPMFAQATVTVNGDSLRTNEFQRRSAGSFTVVQSRPTGAFGRNVGFGYGLAGAYLFRLDRAGLFSIRTDAAFLQYGTESEQVPLSSTIGGRIQVKVSTDNNIVPITIGPQLTWPTGLVRPYANAGIGGQFFFTQSHVRGDSDVSDFASTTNQWDKTRAWVAGAGLYVPVYQRGVKVLIDAGAQYVNGGRARYLKPGSIQDLPNSEIRITPLESETHMVLVRLGVKIGL